jgi:hypothetical protein
MSQFKLLPLKWNGEYFTKPYDRADVYDEPRIEKNTKKGLYYNEPGS